MYLLDTDICIYLMKDSFPALTKRLLSEDPNNVAISAITVYELEYGAAKSRWSERTRDALYSFLAPFNIIPFDAGDAAAAGQLRSFLAQQGSPIGPYDIQIAAQAFVRDMTVVTQNVREFSRVPDLKIEDWVILS